MIFKKQPNHCKKFLVDASGACLLRCAFLENFFVAQFSEMPGIVQGGPAMLPAITPDIAKMAQPKRPVRIQFDPQTPEKPGWLWVPAAEPAVTKVRDSYHFEKRIVLTMPITNKPTTSDSRKK
jgi:hypothetical protein